MNDSSAVKFTKAARFSLKTHPTLNEKWVQGLIEEDPLILGLGDVYVKDKERMQPRAGRLDLLLQDRDPETSRRYEVELQLGSTDESHIIRTIEYWDIERKRYPQYDHCAVLVAEDITSRFLNVISLFNGMLPMVALQMQAMKIGDLTTLVFTKIMDELPRGLEEEDEPPAAPADRAYWERRGSKATIQLTDQLFAIAREIDPSLELQYNRHYIGLFKGGQPFNFILLQPRKVAVNLEIKLPRSDEIDKKIEDAGIDTLPYTKWGRYRLALEAEDVATHRDLLKELMQTSYQLRGT